MRTGRGRGGMLRVVASVVGGGLLVAACGTASSASSATSSSAKSHHSPSAAPSPAASTAPGVTATSINVGAISTLTGPIAANFDAMAPGIQAYFDMVDAHGGINGRKLKLAYNLNTGGNPTEFNSLTHTLIDQDHAFAAVGIATAFFTPNYFVATDTPTYGYDVTGNWQGPGNLFAAGGSVIYYPASAVPVAFLAKQVKAKSVAVVAYGIAASSDACQAIVTGLKHDGINVGYDDLNVQYPGSGVGSDVQRMLQAGTDLVVSCMDVTGNITMARAIQQYGLKTNQLWLNGNTQATLDQYPGLMKGVYFEIQHVPFSAPTKIYPGLGQYLSAMKRYEPSYVYDEVALQGWESAALFADGVKAVGSDLTQKAVIAATNKMTDFTANGLTTPVSWLTAHTKPTPPFCQAYIQVVGKTFVSRFGQGHQVFTCFPADLKPVRVAAPAGTPGA